MNFQEIFTDPTVIWFLVGLGLILLELVIPGFVLIFFGIGAWISSLGCYLFEPTFNIQLLIFFISSILLLALLRGQLRSRFFKEKEEKDEFLNEEFIGKTVVVETLIKPGVEGKVTFHGTLWTARSVDELKVGETAVITGKESICLIVKPK